MKNIKASNITKGGMLIALTIIILYAANFLSFNTLFLLGLTAAIIPLAIIMCDLKTSVMVYAASALLAYMIIPDKTLFLLYAVIFGPYGIVKLFIEKRKNTLLELFLKLLYFNAIIALAFLLYKLFFMPTISIPGSFAPILLGGYVAFFIFDYVLTIFISFISNRRLK